MWGECKREKCIVPKTWLKLLTKPSLDLVGFEAAGQQRVAQWRCCHYQSLSRDPPPSAACAENTLFPLKVVVSPFSFPFCSITPTTAQTPVADLTPRCGSLPIQHNWPVAPCVSWPCEDPSWVAGRKLPWPGSRLKLCVKNWQHWWRFCPEISGMF